MLLLASFEQKYWLNIHSVNPYFHYVSFYHAQIYAEFALLIYSGTNRIRELREVCNKYRQIIKTSGQFSSAIRTPINDTLCFMDEVKFSLVWDPSNWDFSSELLLGKHSSANVQLRNYFQVTW